MIYSVTACTLVMHYDPKVFLRVYFIRVKRERFGLSGKEALQMIPIILSADSALLNK